MAETSVIAVAAAAVACCLLLLPADSCCWLQFAGRSCSRILDAKVDCV